MVRRHRHACVKPTSRSSHFLRVLVFGGFFFSSFCSFLSAALSLAGMAGVTLSSLSFLAIFYVQVLGGFRKPKISKA